MCKKDFYISFLFLIECTVLFISTPYYRYIHTLLPSIFILYTVHTHIYSHFIIIIKNKNEDCMHVLYKRKKGLK